MTLIEEHILKKFRKAVKVNSTGIGTPVWKNLLFFLDLVGQGDFYGTLELTLQGPTIKDLQITKRTFKVDLMYPYLDLGIDKQTTPRFPDDVNLNTGD